MIVAPFRLQSIPVFLKKNSKCHGFALFLFLSFFLWKNKLMMELSKLDLWNCLGGNYLTTWQR